MFVQLGRGEGMKKNRTHILWLINNNNDDGLGLTRSRPVIVCQTVSLIHYYHNIIHIFIFIIIISFQLPRTTPSPTAKATPCIILDTYNTHVHISILLLSCVRHVT